MIVQVQPASVTTLDALARCTMEQLTSLAYGADAPIPLLADVPEWLAEAAYDELDRRMFA